MHQLYAEHFCSVLEFGPVPTRTSPTPLLQGAPVRLRSGFGSCRAFQSPKQVCEFSKIYDETLRSQNRHWIDDSLFTAYCKAYELRPTHVVHLL